jgi:ubiquinone/menaquinone biosynthesis C-methylase UbiE
MKAFLQLFFKLLYHQFAFAYDLVAAAVSFNRWNDWIGEVLALIQGTRILELGHGPGRLQRLLRRDGWFAIGIDESPQMGRLARRNTNNTARLTRGLAQQLPFADESFDTIVSTFPSDYIFDPRTLAEARRCLLPGGRLIVLPVAMPKNRFLEWLYKFTGESPSEAEDVVKKKLMERFVNAEFVTEIFVRDAQSSRLFIVVARRIHAEKIT